MIYDVRSNTGYIAWHLKTVSRKSKQSQASAPSPSSSTGHVSGGRPFNTARSLLKTQVLMSLPPSQDSWIEKVCWNEMLRMAWNFKVCPVVVVYSNVFPLKVEQDFTPV